MKDVAKAADVHFSTVSRALNPTTRDLVKPQIAKRILETAQRLGYRTNSLASSLRTKRSRVVGVVVPDIASLLFPPILEGNRALPFKRRLYDDRCQLGKRS